jgi:hypothetical protein
MRGAPARAAHHHEGPGAARYCRPRLRSIYSTRGHWSGQRVLMRYIGKVSLFCNLIVTVVFSLTPTRHSQAPSNFFSNSVS